VDTNVGIQKGVIRDLLSGSLKTSFNENIIISIVLAIASFYVK